jgi:hypothetical protein
MRSHPAGERWWSGSQLSPLGADKPFSAVWLSGTYYGSVRPTIDFPMLADLISGKN